MLSPSPIDKPRRLIALTVLVLLAAPVLSPATAAPTVLDAAGATTTGQLFGWQSQGWQSSSSQSSSRQSSSSQSSSRQSSSWRWPVDPPRSVTRPYIAPATPYGSGHRGLDITPAAPTAVVYSPADGTVHFAGVVVDRPLLSIRHPDGLISSFEPVSTALVAGDSIRRGDVVGVLEAGHCSAPCLHFGVRLYGEYVSPLNYLGGIPHSVLLPTRPLSNPSP